MKKILFSLGVLLFIPVLVLLFLVLRQDYSLDETFSNKNILQYAHYGILLDSNNMLVYKQGEFLSINGINYGEWGIHRNHFVPKIEQNPNAFGIINLNSNCKANLAFQYRNFTNLVFRKLLVLDKNSYIAITSSVNAQKIVKLNKFGVIDTCFKLNSPDYFAYDFTVQNSNRIIVLGKNLLNKDLWKLFCINSKGNLDSSFSPLYFKSDSKNYSLLPDLSIFKNKLYLSGNFIDFGCRRYYLNGTIDNSFKIDNWDYGFKQSMFIDNRGKVYFSLINFFYDTAYKLVRFDEHGNIDKKFSSNFSNLFFKTVYGGSSINCIDFIDNDKIIIGGKFEKFTNEIVSRNIMVVNYDGSLNRNYFYFGKGFDDEVTNIAVKNKDTIYVVSKNGIYNGKRANQSLMRLIRTRWNLPHFYYHLKPTTIEEIYTLNNIK